MSDDFGDWRIAVVTTLAKDIPPAYPGGPSHKVGSPVYLSTVTKHTKYNNIGFITPSPSALALNISLKSALVAEELQSTLALQDTISPFGDGKSIVKENLPHLYNFFENCMTTVIFGFQAIETYANWVIGQKVDKPMQVRVQSKMKEITPYELERNLSTGDKISQVLPQIFNIASPKGTKVWEDFVKLKLARDSTVHLKSIIAYPKEIDKKSLFFQFFECKPTEFPQLAYNVIEYFLGADSEHRWAKEFEKILKKKVDI